MRDRERDQSGRRRPVQAQELRNGLSKLPLSRRPGPWPGSCALSTWLAATGAGQAEDLPALLAGAAGYRLAWWTSSGALGEPGTGGCGGDPDAGPAAAGVREFHAG